MPENTKLTANANTSKNAAICAVTSKESTKTKIFNSLSIKHENKQKTHGFKLNPKRLYYGDFIFVKDDINKDTGRYYIVKQVHDNYIELNSIGKINRLFLYEEDYNKVTSVKHMNRHSNKNTNNKNRNKNNKNNKNKNKTAETANSKSSVFSSSKPKHSKAPKSTAEHIQKRAVSNKNEQNEN
jgi:flagellar biosynthesis GTPase FlhF